MSGGLVRILAALYGALSFAAALTQLGRGGLWSLSAAAMAAGGAALAASALLKSRRPALALAGAGCAAVFAAALGNGLLGGAPNPLHHLVRLGLSALILYGLAKAAPPGEDP